MPIVNTITGNLLDRFDEGKYDAIIHGANCFHTMGAGIARQIRSRYPDAYLADTEQTVKGDVRKMGDYSYAVLPQGTIINGYTQYGYCGTVPQVNYDSIFKLFSTINEEVDDAIAEGAESDSYLIGIPMIGAGLAGGDWSHIKKLINEATPSVNIELVVWEDEV